MVLEKSIKELDIGKNAAVEHPDPCKDCNVSQGTIENVYYVRVTHTLFLFRSRQRDSNVQQ